MAKANSLIPAAPIKRLIEEWESGHPDVRQLLGPKHAGILLGNTAVLARLTGLSVDLIKSIRSEDQEWVEFDNADKIVMTLARWGWHHNPELEAVYEDFDLGPLDKKRPTVAA